ncbi:MAG: hypothetical protein QOE77_1579 [Blastocatellia bacterium]|jgi:uncharacterized RDD family membrane protein YckC|nr:hypothetical protein [Blastocatellia bacterium]
MQCHSCGASDPRESENCPECQSASALSPANAESAANNQTESRTPQRPTSTTRTKKNRARTAQQPAANSTLIEFPGGGRVPQWRKELSERVRAVQKRKALEAATDSAASETANKPATRTTETAALGLVRPAAAPAINPIVMKALLRIERAHRAPAQTVQGFSRGGAALARRAEPVTELNSLESIEPELLVSEPVNETVVHAVERPMKEHGLVVVPSQPTERPEAVPEELPAETKTAKPEGVRVITERVENAALSYLETLQTAQTEFGTSRDDRAGIPSRTMAALIDLLMIAFAACPFAAGIELWGSNWNDLRVKGLMAGITVVAGFLYLTFSTALAGRTLGMKLFGIRAVDVRSGLMPSGSQSARRALGYILSLATAGLGIFYGLVDAERRTAHDHFSGTIVVHD